MLRYKQQQQQKITKSVFFFSEKENLGYNSRIYLKLILFEIYKLLSNF